MGRLITVIGVICAVLVGLTVYASRHGASYCLRVEGAKQITLIDPQSGASIVKANPRASIPTADGLDESPDGTYVGYLMDNSLSDALTLWLFPLQSGPQPQSILVANNIPTQLQSTLNLNIDWSPDSRHFAFYWQASKNKWVLMIAQPDGTKQVIPVSDDDDIDGYGWSADGAYYAFGIRHCIEQKRTLYFWSRATQQVMKSSVSLQVLHRDNEISDGYELTAWSAVGHNLALIGPANKGSIQLRMIAPEGKLSRTFGVDANLIDPRFYWSPDGKYLAISSDADLFNPSTPRWKLAIFGTDGSANQNVTQSVTDMGTSDGPEWSWVDDKLIYMDTSPQPTGSGFDSDLMAFDAPTQYQSLVAANVYLWAFYGPVQHLIKTQWLEDNRAIAGVVDAVTGKRYDLARGTDAAIQYIDLSPDGRLALVHFTSNNQELAKIETVDSSWEMQLPLDEDAAWSPDSTMLSSINSSTNIVTIVRTDGLILYHNHVNEYLGLPQWQACGSI